MKKERVFWGSILVLGAIALILNKLGYFAQINVFSALLAIALLGISIKSLFRLNYAGVLFPLAFICIIYDDQLGITAITPWTILLAALLGSIGLSMIFKKNQSGIMKNTIINMVTIMIMNIKITGIIMIMKQLM